jgi:hypothetical protein
MQPLLKSLKKKKKKHLLFHRFVNRLGKNKLPEKITSIIVGINSNRRRLQEKKNVDFRKGNVVGSTILWALFPSSGTNYKPLTTLEC